MLKSVIENALLLIDMVDFFLHEWLLFFVSAVFYTSKVFAPKKVYNQTRDHFVLVTGTSSGIGQDVVIKLSKAGYSVIATVRSADDVEKWNAFDTVGHRGRIIPIIMDVSIKSTIQNAVLTVNDLLSTNNGLLIGLINNAGISGCWYPIEFLDSDRMDQVFDVNIKGIIKMVEAFAPLLRQSKGRIINVGSIAGKITRPIGSVYSMSKYAVEALTDALRREMVEFNIPVSLLQPGAISSSIWEKGVNDLEKLKSNTKATSVYESLINRMLAMRQKQRKAMTMTPDLTSYAMMHALTSKYPKTRYLVGLDAKLIFALTSVLPDQVIDFVMLSI